MNPARAQKLNRFIVNDYFTKLEKIVADYQLFDKPDKIFSMDEKGCQLSLHNQQFWRRKVANACTLLHRNTAKM
jgi:hypothetical protein